MREPATIRPLARRDLEALDEWFGPHSQYRNPRTRWMEHLRLAKEGAQIVVVAEADGKAVGFCALLRASGYPPFQTSNVPEINNLLVAPPYRNRGIGRQLVVHLEGMARLEGHREIGLGVGLYGDYGSAQRLYAKLGYVPDGRGVTYRGFPVEPGHLYRADDDLILWLRKRLA